MDNLELFNRDLDAFRHECEKLDGEALDKVIAAEKVIAANLPMGIMGRNLFVKTAEMIKGAKVKYSVKNETH